MRIKDSVRSYNNLYDYMIIVGVYFAIYFYTKDIDEVID